LICRAVRSGRAGGRAQFNYVHNALDKHAQLQKPALICEGEEGMVRTLSYPELLAETNRCANALRALGIGKGDRVGLYLPMIAEVVIAQLALGKLGAIYTPIFSGFGAEAVASRLEDAEAKVLITCDGIQRRGGWSTKNSPTKPWRSPSVERSSSSAAAAPIRPGTTRDVWC
jgi:acetyl-CoA synthetase